MGKRFLCSISVWVMCTTIRQNVLAVCQMWRDLPLLMHSSDNEMDCGCEDTFLLQVITILPWDHTSLHFYFFTAGLFYSYLLVLALLQLIQIWPTSSSGLCVKTSHRSPTDTVTAGKKWYWPRTSVDWVYRWTYNRGGSRQERTNSL